VLPIDTRRRWALAVIALVVLGGLGFGGYTLVQELSDEDEGAPAPAPDVVIREVQPEAAEGLGFPEFATKNTTRIAGTDPIADAAAVALAVFPSVGGLEGPPAVTLVEASDWPAGIAAASLVADPVRAPILFTDGADLPEQTADALRALGPRGSRATNGRQLIRVAPAIVPGGARTLDVTGDNPAEVAAEIARLRQQLSGARPEHVLITTSDEAGFAMPAAAWAARSGDPILFAQADSVPEPTVAALRRLRGVPTYVLGPTAAISNKAFGRIRKASGSATRVAGEDPVRNAITFARFAEGSFGWNINDPGHGLVIANVRRPLDAAAAAPLSASGTWGPLLLTESAATVPAALRGYLLDLKPGFQDDPTRAVYNHVWLVGDESAVSVPFQAQVDELAELAEIRSGRGESVLGPPPGTPERER
jgi:hypothetical protein